MSVAARRSHRGDEYQLAVAVHWLVRLLSDPNIASIQVDAVSLPTSPEAVDVDDIVITYSNGTTRHIQAKKNQPSQSCWKISDSDLKDELIKAHRQLQKAPDAIIEFCSHTPFGDLAALVESTRDYVGHDVFQAQASSKLRTALAKLERILGCSGDIAFNLVRHIEIGSAHNFDGWEAVNLSALQSQVDDPETAVAVLTRMARGNQSGLRLPPGPLQRSQIVQALSERGVEIVSNVVPLDTTQVSRSFAAASADLANWKTTLPNDDWLERPELDILCERIANELVSLTLILGEPGCGKSALLAKLARKQVALGIPVLAIKADYLSEAVVDTRSLGDHLNLPADPIDCVVALAKSTKVLVLVDQMDALADLLVQHSTRLRAPMDLIRGLSGVQNIHIVASCRVFEHRHDTRLRNLDAETMTLDFPSWDNVEATLKKSGIHAGGWNASIREDLRSPQTLNLFLQLIKTTDEADLLLGYQHMLGELWKQQVLSDASGRAREALYAITTRMAEREVLWLPEALFETFHLELQRLSRSGILLCEGGRIGFRHQTLYEYIRARSFLDVPGQLTDAVLSRQHSLRVRPLLWHSLTYMRAVDRPTYAHEIERLWHANLRPHLKMLLIEFLGQLQDPSSSETALVAEKWDDAWYRRRILATAPGSPGWFDWLAHDHLVEIMRLPVEEARSALPVLWRALPTRRSRVLDLIRSHWQPIAEKDHLTWFVLEQLPTWDTDCIALGRQILARTGISGWQANHMASVVSATDPSQAPLLLDAWLLQKTADAQQPAEEAARIAKILNEQELHDLPAIAEAAPREFVAAIWPWVLKTIRLLALDEHDFVVGYRNVDMRFPDLSDEDLHRKPFIAAVIVGVRLLAERYPEDFLAFLQSNRQVDLMPVQRLLALGLRQVAAQHPADALAFLLEDPRRLVIGTYRDAHADSNHLIRAVSPHLDEEQVQQLERTVREWNRYTYLPDDDARTRLHRLQWTRQHRLRVLRAIPQEYMSAACRRHVAEEERAFPGLDDADVRISGLREISSPMDASHMQRAPEEDILSLFAELTDQTQWDHPRHPMRGGVIQASRQLAELAKTAPDKAIRLIRRMSPGSNEIAVGAVLRALGESKYDAAALHSLILELDQTGFNSAEFRGDAANAATAVSDGDSPLPQDLFDLLETWLRDDPDSTKRDDDAEYKDLSGSILWSYGGSVMVPQGNYPVLSALTRACLSQEPPRTDEWLSILEAHLGRKEQLKVWEVLAYDLRWLACADHGRAQRFLLDLFEAYPGLCKSRAGAILLAHIQNWISAETANILLDRLIATGTSFSAQAAGEILMLRYALQGEEESSLQDLLEQLLVDTDEDSLSAQCRIGLAYAAAELWSEADFRARLHPHLLRLLDMGDEKVTAAAARLFAQRHLKPDTASRELLDHLQARPELLKQVADNDLGECLVSILEAAPLVVANVVNSLLNASGDEFFNGTSSRYFLVDNLLTISLRLQEMGAPFQELGAHVFERLLEFNTPEARNVALDLDKRTTNVPNTRSPIRRRRNTIAGES